MRPASSAFSPNGDGRRDDFRLSAEFSEGTEWTLEIRAPGQDALGVFVARGTAQSTSVSWDGRAGGMVVDEGVYEWTLEGRDESGNEMTPITGTVVADRTAPVLLGTAAGPNPFNSKRKRFTTITLSANEAATVRARIVRKGRVVASLGKQELAASDAVSFRWGGRNGRYVRNGRYRVVLRAVDIAANRTVNRALTIRIKGRPRR